MTKKLTKSIIDDRVYDGFYSVIGRGTIARFLENLVRPFIVTDSRADAYAELSTDIARESEADEWSEALATDGLDASR
jgi:hypothetical protein